MKDVDTGPHTRIDKKKKTAEKCMTVMIHHLKSASLRVRTMKWINTKVSHICKKTWDTKKLACFYRCSLACLYAVNHYLGLLQQITKVSSYCLPESDYCVSEAKPKRNVILQFFVSHKASHICATVVEKLAL